MQLTHSTFTRSPAAPSASNGRTDQPQPKPLPHTAQLFSQWVMVDGNLVCQWGLDR